MPTQPFSLQLLPMQGRGVGAGKTGGGGGKVVERIVEVSKILVWANTSS